MPVCGRAPARRGGFAARSRARGRQIVWIASTLLLAALHGLGGEVRAEPQVNQALHAAYRLEPPPNYPKAMDKTGTDLTDGRIPDGRIWTSGEAVGWSWRMPVTIALDLPSPAPIDHVRIHIASGTDAGVFYPSQISVFGGDGSGGLDFLGASTLGRDEDNSRSPSHGAIDIRFPSHEIDRLLIVVFARGAYAFVSEVEAFGSSPAGKTLAGELPDVAAVLRFAAEHRRAAIAALSRPQPTGPDAARRWAMPLGEGGAQAASAGGCSVERIDPWAGEHAAPAAEGPAAAQDPAAPLAALSGGHDYAAWRIVNRSDAEVPVRVDVGAPAEVGTRVFALAHVQALNYAWVPDVVVPFDGAMLPAHSAMLALVEARPAVAGRHELEVSLECGGRARPFEMTLVAIPADPEVPPLHGNLWTYLHEPAHAPVAHALACDTGFLSRYGVDTVTVHPEALLDDGRARRDELLRRYFETHRDAARLLLYMDIKARPWTFLDLPEEEAAAALKRWWDRVKAAAKDAGAQGELLLYPIDEPRFDDLGAMMRFHSLVKDAGIDARIHATLEKRSLAILPWVDVAQLLRPSQLDVGLAALAGEVHGYDTREDAKLLPLGGYYRRQGWDAYALDLAGTGVWSAWDSTGLTSPETGWNPFTGEGERDFGLIYVAPDGCAWPSLRLLAWRRGLEENRLLRQCERRRRAGDVDDLVRRVLNKGGLAAASHTIGELAEACG